MDIEIFVHGVPNGQSFWGKEEDRNYFGNFYGQNNSDADTLVKWQDLLLLQLFGLSKGYRK